MRPYARIGVDILQYGLKSPSVGIFDTHDIRSLNPYCKPIRIRADGAVWIPKDSLGVDARALLCDIVRVRKWTCSSIGD